MVLHIILKILTMTEADQLGETRHDEYMDCSDESLVEQDYLDTMEFCLELEANEIIDDEQFDYLEI